MVPNGWKAITLGDLVTDSAFGPRFSSNLYSENGAIGTIRTTDLCDEGTINYNTIPYANLDIDEFKSHILDSGDLLITRSGTCGIPCIFEKQDKPIIAGAFLIRFKLKSDVDASYLHYLLKYDVTQHHISKMASGGVQKNLTGTSLKKLKLEVPEHREQRKIAKILSKWDKAIVTTERLIDNSKQQKKALMQQLLTGKRRLLDESGKPFEGEWEEVKLGDLSSKVTKGTTPSTNGFSFQQDGINFVKVESISSSGRFDRSKFAYIDNDCYESFKRSQLEKDDILFSIAGALGRTALVDETILPANTNQALAIVRLNRSRTVHRYIIYFLNSPRIASVIKGLTAKAAQPNLSLKDVNGLTILLPSLEEQEKISTALFNADKEIELLEQQLADLKQEKKALMQQLLTGKRRVKVDEEAVA
jgi:type I restriction enzyme S subunit